MENSINKKGMALQILLFVIITSLGFSCSKEKQEVIRNDWQVESIKVHSDSVLQFPYSGSQYIWQLTFNNGKYRFVIGSNSSSGDVKFKGKENIEFKGGITFVAWDSDFSENVFTIFSTVSKYKTDEETLILINDSGGIINFKKR